MVWYDWEVSKEKTFFWYDVETSGLSGRYDRAMQFAGQRTTLDLKEIGEPINFLIKLPEDILPSPEALLVTGITPQMTQGEGIAEHEFAQQLSEEIFTPGTIAVGYNSVRFDDEFIRHTLWRNFYDPYEWSWSEDRSRWDLLDMVRLTRALRPDGIKWPVGPDGKENNKLDQLAPLNKIKQEHAHDAMSDVEATLGIARMLRDRQPKLFDYLLKMRDKKEVNKLVNLANPQPFIYASGRYTCPGKTTAAFPIAEGHIKGATLVYDLRVDPTTIDLEKLDKDYPWKDLPIKEIQDNRCPAIAPLGVLDGPSQKRLDLSLETINANREKIDQNKGIIDQMVNIWRTRPDFPPAADVEGQLYDGFLDDADKFKQKAVREANEQTIADLHPSFVDDRLPELLLRYKAREFPKSLSKEEQKLWQTYKSEKFARELPGLQQRLAELAKEGKDDYILTEIQLWAESNMLIE